MRSLFRTEPYRSRTDEPCRESKYTGGVVTTVCVPRFQVVAQQGGKLLLGETVGAYRASCQPVIDHRAGNTEARRVAGDERDLQVGTWTNNGEEGQLIDAIEALDLLVQRGSYIHNSAFYHVIKRCIAQKDLTLGRRVHALVVKSGYGSNAFVANHIICMYASHGRLEEATEAFAKVAAPNRFMWASIILAHSRHGHPADAIKLYRQMRESRVKPDNRIFVAVLTACATAEDLSSGREVHADILGTANKPDIFVGNCLVDMYSKCRSLEDARKVFDNQTSKNVVTWTAMISGYAQHGLGQEALTLYTQMQQEGTTTLNSVTYVCLLQACASAKSLHHGKQLHAQIQDRGLEGDVVIGTCLVDMYSKCGSLADARVVFENMPTRDVVTWTAMIAGYAQHGQGEGSLTLYERMQQEGIVPANHVTFVCLLQACTSGRALHQGQQLHAQIQEVGLCDDVVVGTCLVDMYSKCGCLEDARRVFDKLPRKNVVTWNTMIAGYAQNGLCQEALSLYGLMQQEGISAVDSVTFLALIHAISSGGTLHQGRQLHAQIIERGLDCDVVTGNSLVNMYAKCESLEDARSVFDNLPTRDVVAWNAIIAGYAHLGLTEEALSLYRSMQQEGITPANTVTFVCLLQACGNEAGLEKGKEIHAQILESGLEDTDLLLKNALIDMYGKCGSMVDAQQVFDAMSGGQDLVSWNALIAGYARQGKSALVFHLFQRMREAGTQPDGITFLSVLTVCSHGGLVHEGEKYFEAMTRDFGIRPIMEHYNCMVDLLARAGHLNKAMEMAETMPFQPDTVVWKCLLGACQKWNNLDLGRRAFQHAVRLDETDAAPYILMSNIYSAAGMQDNADKVQALRVQTQAWKRPGQSSYTDMAGAVHSFIVGDRQHPKRHHIDSELRNLLLKLKEDGYAIHHLNSLSSDTPADATNDDILAIASGLPQ